MNSSYRNLAPQPRPSNPKTRENFIQDLQQDRNDHQKQHQTNQRNLHTFGSLIQSNSIQSHFTILSNQRDSFIRETDEAEKELKQVQTEYQCIKQENDRLIQSNRRSKEVLGQRMEKLAMLNEEESRFNQLVQNEFHAIHDCTKHSKSLEKKKEEATKRFTTGMDHLNFELAALLERRIQKKTERCITVHSIEAVVLPEFEKALLEKSKPQLLNQKENLYNSIKLLKSASEQRKQYIARLDDLRGFLHEHHVLGVDKKKDVSGVFGDDSTRQSTQTDFFYGASDCN